MCCPQQVGSKETLKEIKSSSNLCSEDDLSCESSEEKLSLLKDKLLKKNENLFDLTKQEKSSSLNKIINHGIYSEAVISKLLKNGLSKASIIKTMKVGIRNLDPDEIKFFNVFNITPEMFNSCNILHQIKTVLENKIDSQLVEKLMSLELNEQESLNIVLNGLASQEPCYLFKLTIDGIDTTKIIHWHTSVCKPSDEVLQFLQKLNLEESILKFVVENGITENALEFLNNFGFSKIHDESDHENSQCSCNDGSQNEIIKCSKSKEEFKNNEEETGVNDIQRDDNFENKILEHRNYLRKNFMAPLIWALGRSLKYNPTSSIHYIACQLFRWKNNNLGPHEMKEMLNFVIDSITKKNYFCKDTQELSDFNMKH